MTYKELSLDELSQETGKIVDQLDLGKNLIKDIETHKYMDASEST